MKETGKKKRGHLARQTPTSIHPATPPALVSSIDSIFLAVNSSLIDSATSPFQERIVTSQILYRPGLLGIARIIFHGSRWEVHSEREMARVVAFPPQPLVSDWESGLMEGWDNRNSLTAPVGVAFYVYDQTYDFSQERMDVLQEGFMQHLISHEVMEIEYNPSLKLGRKLDETEESFSLRCMDAASESLERETKTLEETMQRLQNRLKEKLDREVREMGSDMLESQQRGNTAQNHQVEMDRRESIATIDDVKAQLEDLERLRESKTRESEEIIAGLANERQRDLLRISRTNVEILRFCLVWLPYAEFVIQEEDHRRLELVRGF